MLGNFTTVASVLKTDDFLDGNYGLCGHLSVEKWKPEDKVYLIQDTYTTGDRGPAGQTILCIACGTKHDEEESAELEYLLDSQDDGGWDWDGEDTLSCERAEHRTRPIRTGSYPGPRGPEYEEVEDISEPMEEVND